jgi:hypothetical protein
LQYSARKHTYKPVRLTTDYSGRINLENNFIDELKAFIPEKLTQWKV